MYHRSLIQICVTPSVESTPGFFPSASPVMSRLTSSFTCQLISIIITTIIIHHSFTPGSKPTFQQILPTLDFFYLRTAFMTTGLDRTYHAHRFIFSFTFYIFLFVPCGGLSWLPVSFLLHVKYTLSYRTSVCLEYVGCHATSSSGYWRHFYSDSKATAQCELFLTALYRNILTCLLTYMIYKNSACVWCILLCIVNCHEHLYC